MIRIGAQRQAEAVRDVIDVGVGGEDCDSDRPRALSIHRPILVRAIERGISKGDLASPLSCVEQPRSSTGGRVVERG